MWEVDARAMQAACKARGIPVRRKLSSKAAAEEWAAELMEMIRTEPTTRIKVWSLCERFLESKAASVSPDTLKSYRTSVRHLQAFCTEAGIIYTDQLKRGVIGEFVDSLLRKVSKRTAGQYVAELSACFGWATRRGYIGRNLFAGKAKRSRKSTRRVLTDAEREAITGTDTQHRDLWLLMLNTGLRVIEMTRLDEDTVRLESPMPHLQVLGKGSKERTVPLDEVATAAARRLLRRHGGQIWPGTREQLHRAWQDDRAALGLSKDITPHVFRHDFASWLVNRENLPLPDVQRILGHADLATTAIYLHPDGRRTGAALKGRGKALSGNPVVTESGKR